MIIPIINQTVKTFAKKDIKGLMCPDPFNGISISTAGDVSMCSCQMWHPTVIGNILDTPINDMLNSQLAHDIRNSIRHGTYEYCDESRCAIMINNKLVPITDLGPDDFEKFDNPKIVDTPRYVYIAGDQTCNLSCPSCRTRVVNNDDEQDQKNKTVMGMILEQVFSKTDTRPVTVYLSSEGEVFASRSMLSFLEQFPIDRYPNLELFLQSNGLLVKNRWDSIKHLHNNIFRLSITADSQVPDVYANLRRGGTLDKLIENLEFIKEIRKTNKFELSIRMVVQQDNFAEAEDFYNFAMQYDCTEVEFMRLLNWNTYTSEEFKKIDVLDSSHSQFDDAISIFQNLKSKYNNILFYHFSP